MKASRTAFALLSASNALFAGLPLLQVNPSTCTRQAWCSSSHFTYFLISGKNALLTSYLAKSKRTVSCGNPPASQAVSVWDAGAGASAGKGEGWTNVARRSVNSGAKVKFTLVGEVFISIGGMFTLI